MATAARNADSYLTVRPQNAIVSAAIDEEREKFVAYVGSLTAEQINAAVPLPFHRTLAKDESNRLWAELEAKWGVDGGYWYPLKSTELPQGMLAFHTDYFDREKEAFLRELLSRRASSVSGNCERVATANMSWISLFSSRTTMALKDTGLPQDQTRARHRRLHRR